MFEPVETYLFNVLKMFGVWSVVSICAASPQMQDEDEKVRVLQEASDLAKQLVNPIEKK